MSSVDQDIQELKNLFQEGFSRISEKIQATGERSLANAETIKNLVKLVDNTPMHFPALEKLPDEEQDRPDEACLCGNVLMADADFCRKCGRPRPEPEQESEDGSVTQEGEKPAEVLADGAEGEEPETKTSKSKLERQTSGASGSQSETEGRKSVAKGFGNSRSFSKIMHDQADATRASYIVDTFGKRRLHFDKLRDLTRNRKFQITFAVMIVINAVFTAIIADVSCRGVIDVYWKKSALFESTGVPFDALEHMNWEVPNWILYVDIAFAAVFSMEIGMRILGEEFMFFIGPDYFWNNADFLLVLVSLAELALLALDVDMNVVRLVRLTRVGRTIRLVRLLKFFRDLRVMLISVGASLLPLLWATLFLSIFISVFAIVFLLACTNYMESAGPLEGENADAENTEIVTIIRSNFYTFPMTFQSLFMSVTGGLSWVTLEANLRGIHPIFGLIYLFFILFTILAVLNIITAIFVESATALAQTDKDLVTQRNQEKIAKNIAELRDVFLELDADGGGSLTLEEFTARADDPQVIAYFQALEIDAMKATDFFKLFDMDGSGELEIEEFVAGCMRIKGGAKAVDIETIMHENQKLMTKFKDFFNRSGRGFTRIEQNMQKMYENMMAKFGSADTKLLDLQQTAVPSNPGPSPRSHSGSAPDTPEVTCCVKSGQAKVIRPEAVKIKLEESQTTI